MEHARFWLLVADAARARIFVGTSPTADLSEVRDFVSPQSRTPEHDHVSDRPGRAIHGSGDSVHGSHAETHKKEAAAADFAHELGELLNQAKTDKKFETLTIVAAPAFLGLLRHQLSPTTTGCVLEEIAKDLTTRPVSEIQGHLTRLAL